MTVENQILNKVLSDKNIALIMENDLTNAYFPIYQQQFDFIINHYRRYDVVPDITTFLSKFPTFELFDIRESEKHLIDALREEYLFTQFVPIMQRTNELLKENSNKALEFLSTQMPTLTTLKLEKAIDLTKDGAKTRYNTYLAKSDMPNSVMSSGFTELDMITGGWERGEELVTVLGRLNQGKSWIVEYYGVAAWQQNFRVGMYSGEMSAIRCGYRFDTLNKHFSNRSLVRGDRLLEKEYKEYVAMLEEMEIPFFLKTPKELGGKATVPKLKSFAQSNQLDALFIDQYSLMDDIRGNSRQENRLAYAHISEDLFILSGQLGIPIICASQANRAGANRSTEDGPPEVEHIAESDAIGQNSSKVIAIRQNDNTLEMQVRKNRESGLGDKLVYAWDIDIGKFTFIRTSETPRQSAATPQSSSVVTATGQVATFSRGVEVF
jgi:replicative DNA helicase